MKARTICIILALMLAFGIAVHALAAGRPNPGVPVGYKTIGPNVKGTLIVGWKYTSGDEQDKKGQVDAFLYTGGRLFASVLHIDNPELSFLDSVPEEVTGYPFPLEIAEYYNLQGIAVVKVLGENDVTNFTKAEDIENLGVPGSLSYQHVIYCEVKLSFLILKE